MKCKWWKWFLTKGRTPEEKERDYARKAIKSKGLQQAVLGINTYTRYKKDLKLRELWKNTEEALTDWNNQGNTNELWLKVGKAFVKLERYLKYPEQPQ